ncbi:rho GTPase-activating protein 27-like isoform X2 [Corvus moneduloides]|uniref:rho GTPase-activating protein 27-like isoform X2 n=1 Tax=Corvus moneduloides TaxID=1196302 RepID=UPI001361F5DD|nr:rho GTPase-activating protein 27-like isoform X2 [Corvus moneduloides]
MLPMLPRCRWRRPGRAVWLRALYSYRYRADDGRDVAMAAGERLLLLRRATPDWWQVRRPRDPPWARPFFVPAAYVAEEEPGNSGTQSPETPTGAPPGAPHHLPHRGGKAAGGPPHARRAPPAGFGVLGAAPGPRERPLLLLQPRERHQLLETPPAAPGPGGHGGGGSRTSR